MAIIYNITLNVDHAIAPEWLQWMKTVHIPDVMRTGMFTDYRILQLLGDEDSGGITYAVQYTCRDMETYWQYTEVFAPALQAEHSARYKDKFVAFRTLLEVVE
jgi:hypothetical protein